MHTFTYTNYMHAHLIARLQKMFQEYHQPAQMKETRAQVARVLAVNANDKRVLETRVTSQKWIQLMRLSQLSPPSLTHTHTHTHTYTHLLCRCRRCLWSHPTTRVASAGYRRRVVDQLRFRLRLLLLSDGILLLLQSMHHTKTTKQNKVSTCRLGLCTIYLL